MVACEFINDYPKCHPYFPRFVNHGMFSPDFELTCIEEKYILK